VAPGQDFSEHFGFPCQTFHRLLHTHRHPSSGAGTTGQIITDVPSGLGLTLKKQTKTNSMVWVRERTVPTERPPLVGEVSFNFFVGRGCRVVDRIFGCLDRSRYYFFQVASQLYSRGWVDPVPDPLLPRKSTRAGNPTRDLWICSQELWSLDHRGGPVSPHNKERIITTVSLMTRVLEVSGSSLC
jgi:hypothetical protein